MKVVIVEDIKDNEDETNMKMKKINKNILHTTLSCIIHNYV